MEKEFLAFQMGGEEYAVPIENVQEIKQYEQHIPIPNAPEYVRGIMNLRGDVISLLDLAAALKKNPTGVVSRDKQDGQQDGASTQKNSVTIVLDYPPHKIAVLVDAVSEVVHIEEEKIQPPPLLPGPTQQHIIGLAQFSDRLIIILDILSVLKMKK